MQKETDAESSSGINKKKWMSLLLNILMELMTYLLIRMKMLSINIMHRFYNTRMMKMYVPNNNTISAK